MITEENWVNFIKTFFGAEVSSEWVHHVAVGWNYNKNEPGCNCSFKWYSGAEECEIYTGVREAKEQYKLENAADQSIVAPESTLDIDLAGVENFLERGSDEFYEEDEPLEDVVTAFEDGEKGLTNRPTGASVDADDYINALQPSNDELAEDTQTLPSITETGGHPRLKELVKEYMEAHQDEAQMEFGPEDTQMLTLYSETDVQATTEFMEAIDTSDEDANVAEFEEEGPGHGYWEKGDHK